MAPRKTVQNPAASLCTLTYRVSCSDAGMDRRVGLDVACLVGMPEESAMANLVLSGERAVSIGVPAEDVNRPATGDQSRFPTSHPLDSLTCRYGHRSE